MSASSSESPPAVPAAQAARRPRFRLAIYGLLSVIGFLAGATAWILLGVHLPSDDEVTARRVIVLKSAEGQDLFQRGRLRLPAVDVKDMPTDLVNAVLSIEDRHFYEHGPIDLRSIARALKDNITAGRTVAGGSTITQQLVKVLFLSPERTYARKVREAVIALWIEHRLSKDEILTSYLNNVYLGSGATGLPAAAKLYFGKKMQDLSLPEAAMLAGMINAPSQDDPLHDLGAARTRAATVLDAMVEDGKLTQQAAIVAKLHPAIPAPAELSPPSAGWFVDWIYTKVAGVVPPLDGPVRIRTTLDLRLQQAAADIIEKTLAKYGRERHVGEAALVAMRPDGAVVAMVGGKSYSASQYNRAVQAERQPGSAFKLFDYYAALRHGFSPDDRILDAPVNIHGWQPENYGHRAHGRVTLTQAFAESLNDATVRLSQQVGIGEVVAAARDLGLRGRLQNNPSLALGTSEVSLIDLTSAYAAVRAGKAPVAPWGISGIKMRDDQDYVKVARPDEAQHGLGPYQGELIELLQAVVQHGTGRAASLDGFAAGKTGTTQDYRDAWFVGFDASLVVGVWVGNDDHSPMQRVVGGSIPAQIWKEFMEQSGSAATTAEGRSDAPMARAVQSPLSISPDGSDGTQPAETPGEQCDIQVCTRFYHSFRASDCTYQPYSGPRQYCAR
jgi:1A family penicillin-binding protein